VADRWRLGDLPLRLCVEPPGGPARCAARRLAPDTAALRGRFPASRPGGWRVSARTRDAHISTGISKPSVLNWQRQAKRQAARAPDVVVMFLGANDGFSMGSAACCGEAWVAEYARRARTMMIRRAAARARRDVAVIDLVDVFTPAGALPRLHAHRGSRHTGPPERSRAPEHGRRLARRLGDYPDSAPRADPALSAAARAMAAITRTTAAHASAGPGPGGSARAVPEPVAGGGKSPAGAMEAGGGAS
jgi:hypothetical protein